MPVNHITISVADLVRSFEFYTRVLHAKPIMKSESSAYVELDGTWIAFVQEREQVPIGAGCYTHIAFSASIAEINRIRALVDSGVIDSWQHNRSEGESVYFLDPECNKLEYHAATLEDRIAEIRSSQDSKIELFE